MGYSDKEEVCRICGKSPISSFHSGTRYRRNDPPYYCSFKCNAIGERQKLLIVSFVFAIIAIACIIMLFLDDVPHAASIIVTVFACLATLLFLSNNIYGYIANSKRKEQEEEEQQQNFDTTDDLFHG